MTPDSTDRNGIRLVYTSAADNVLKRKPPRAFEAAFSISRWGQIAASLLSVLTVVSALVATWKFVFTEKPQAARTVAQQSLIATERAHAQIRGSGNVQHLHFAR